MKTCCDSIPCAAMRQPSRKRNGTRSMISRSLNVPGSASSALTTRWCGFGRWSGFGTNDHLRPVGKKAPPRPRSPDASSSAITSSGDSARALRSAVKPPAFSYSPMSRTERPSVVPAKTMLGCSATELLDDPGDVLRLHAQPVPVVDGDHRCPAAAPEALDRPERVRAILGGRAGGDAELALERLDDLLRPGEPARDVRAHLDVGSPDGLEVVLVVERRDGEAVRGRELERVGDLADGVRREP